MSVNLNREIKAYCSDLGLVRQVLRECFQKIGTYVIPFQLKEAA